MARHPKPTHPKAIADAPTLLLMVPYPISCIVVATATEAVCCQIIDTKANRLAATVAARAICACVCAGKSFTSLTSTSSSSTPPYSTPPYSTPPYSTPPSLTLSSSCQRGKLAMIAMAMTAKAMATILYTPYQFGS